MKTWHWIVIGGVVLVGGYFLLTSEKKVGDTAGGASAGAPPLPNVSFANPRTGQLFAFSNSFTRGRY
jgi:hypothetical protein